MRDQEISVRINAIEDLTGILKEIKKSLDQLSIPPELVKSTQILSSTAVNLKGNIDGVNKEFDLLKSLGLPAVFITIGRHAAILTKDLEMSASATKSLRIASLALGSVFAGLVVIDLVSWLWGQHEAMEANRREIEDNYLDALELLKHGLKGVTLAQLEQAVAATKLQRRELSKQLDFLDQQKMNFEKIIAAGGTLLEPQKRLYEHFKQSYDEVMDKYREATRSQWELRDAAEEARKAIDEQANTTSIITLAEAIKDTRSKVDELKEAAIKLHAEMSVNGETNLHHYGQAVIELRNQFKEWGIEVDDTHKKIFGEAVHAAAQKAAQDILNMGKSTDQASNIAKKGLVELKGTLKDTGKAYDTTAEAAEEYANSVSAQWADAFKVLGNSFTDIFGGSASGLGQAIVQFGQFMDEQLGDLKGVWGEHWDDIVSMSLIGLGQIISEVDEALGKAFSLAGTLSKVGASFGSIWGEQGKQIGAGIGAALGFVAGLFGGPSNEELLASQGKKAAQMWGNAFTDEVAQVESVEWKTKKILTFDRNCKFLRLPVWYNYTSELQTTA